MAREVKPCPLMGIPIGQYTDLTDKQAAVETYNIQMLQLTQRMFKYTGLPDSMPQRNVEIMLQTYGKITIADVGGSLYALNGSLGGEPNPYYMPTLSIVANPALKLSKEFKIDDNCIVIPNDSYYTGLLPVFNRLSSLLADIDITIRMAAINARTNAHISAMDDRTKASAVQYLKDLEAGKLGVIADSAFLEAIKVVAADSASNKITQLVELRQYVNAARFNYIGVNSNYNMKRESITSSEVQMNADSLFPFPQDMLEQRKIGWDKVNDMFGTNIQVEFDSSWADKLEELELNNELMQAQVDGANEPDQEGESQNEQSN